MKRLNLYTDGGQYYYENSVTEYVGYYNTELSAGASEPVVYSGRSSSKESFRLVPIPEDIVRYKNAGGKDVSDELVIIQPSPTTQDYKRGWFNRYFARKTNDTTAQYYEIDKDQYDKIRNKMMPLYTAVQLRWKISGRISDIVNASGDIVEPGVSDTNNRSIKLVAFQHPNLVFRLQNLIEFWEGKTGAYFGPPLTSGSIGLEVTNKQEYT